MTAYMGCPRDQRPTQLAECLSEKRERRRSLFGGSTCSNQSKKGSKRERVARASSEIPLPSPLFCSPSYLGDEPTWVESWSTHPGADWPLQPGRPAASSAKSGPLAGLDDPKSIEIRIRNTCQMGSLAGAAHLLHHNAGVQKHGSDGAEISWGAQGQMSC